MSPASTATTYQLHFGRLINVPELGAKWKTKVSDRQFDEFVDENIIPNFDSFTIVYGRGYWKGDREDVTVVTIVSENLDDAFLIHEIASNYKRDFNQEAVLVNTFTSFPNLI
jgi:hypothetical protein